MGELAKGGRVPAIPKRKPDKVETYAGKHTARRTETYKQPDGSEVRVTRKIEKNNDITDKIEVRHQ